MNDNKKKSDGKDKWAKKVTTKRFLKKDRNKKDKE